MQLAIRYVSRFEYDEQVRESHNMLRACPANNEDQTLQSFSVMTVPEARLVTFSDYWGTRVDAFGITEPHWFLEVVAESVVETRPKLQLGDLDVPMSAYTDDVTRIHSEYLNRTRHTGWNHDITAEARRRLAKVDGAVSAILAIEAAVKDALDYAPGTSYIGVPLADLVESGKGVCQDFAHLAIALARSVGIPARYVSGYLYAADQSTGDEPREAEVEIQTHAWFEALVPGWGWWALDPTNPGPVGERHVKIGHGRDYDDVMPLRGVYHGDPEHRLGVSVQISREELSARQSQQ